MDLQDVANLTIPEGGVKTIHDKNNRLLWGAVGYDTKYAGDTTQDGEPTPDAPVTVNVVTGAQTVMINDGGGQSATYKVDLTGKNLFNCPSTANTTANTVFTKIDSNSFRTDFTKTTTTMQSSFTQIQLLGLLPNTTYTISCSAEVTGDSFDRAGQFRMHIGSSWSSFYNGKATFTTTTNVSNIFLAASNAQDITTPGSNSVVFSNVQLELGSTATTYEPYYNYELCKIGNYQDYIYKSGDDWYLHKMIKKMVFNGSSGENWDNLQNTKLFRIRVTDLIGQDDGTVAGPVLSNYYTPTAYNNLSNSQSIVDYGVALRATSANGVGIKNIDVADVAGFKTWLSNNNTTVYAPFATPTDTQITNTILISQLNAINQWLTRYGYNATVYGNLPIIIKQTNL